MKYSIFTLAILLGPSVIASPHRHFHLHHAPKHERRGEEPPVAWVTEVATKTVQVTTTVWVTSKPEPTQVTGENEIPADPTNAPKLPAQFFEPESFSAKASPEAEHDMTMEGTHGDPEEHMPEDQTPEPKNQLQIEANETSEDPQVSQAMHTSISAPAQDSATLKDAIVPGQDLSTKGASAASNTTAIHDHATAATCSSSAPCNGDITYYDPGAGYGACGWQNTKDEPVVALPHEFMGSKSNGNSYCGKTITIVRDGKKSTARVVDKCMGCSGFSIDLSDAVFTQLAALSVGRTSAKWWIN